jgi:hypothetical protein
LLFNGQLVQLVAALVSFLNVPASQFKHELPETFCPAPHVNARAHDAVNPEYWYMLSEVNFSSRLGPEDSTAAGREVPETPFIKTVELVEVPS